MKATTDRSFRRRPVIPTSRADALITRLASRAVAARVARARREQLHEAMA
jgi:hypothetical protein